MKSLPVFIAAAAMACAPAAFPLPQDGTLRKAGTDYLEKTRGKRLVLEFRVESSRAVGYLGEIGWVGLYGPGGGERVGISNFSGTPLVASIAAEPGVYDVYVLSQANAGKRKFVRSVDARSFQPGDIIPVTLSVTEGWDGPASAASPKKPEPAPARAQVADETARRIEEAQRAAELRAGQRSRSGASARTEDTERRIEEAQRAAELRAGRRPVESAQAAPAAQSSPASRPRTVAPSSAAAKPAPTATQASQSAAKAAGTRGTFSLKIFEGYRFSDGATVKSDDKSADIRFYYVMRSMGPYVYLGAEKIAQLPAAATRRFSASETASWKDYVFGPEPGYFGVVSKGRHYLVRLETYEDQGKAASFWKMNFSWQALD